MKIDDLTLEWIDQPERLNSNEIAERLSALRRRNYLIMEMGREGILLLDARFIIEFANQRACEILEMSHDEIIAKNFSSFLEPNDTRFLEQVYRIARQGLDGAYRVCSEFLLRNIETEGKTVEVCLVAEAEDGEIKALAFLHDLTDRARMANELKKANHFLKNIIQHSVDGIIAADMKGNIIIFNEGAERMLGYTSDQVLNEVHITNLYEPPEAAREVMERLRSEQMGGRGRLSKTQVFLKDNSGKPIPCLLSAAIIYEGVQEIATVGIFTDLRERIEMQKKLDDAQQQLLQSEKMASIGKLAAGVAHEINNPLGGILMYATMVLEELSQDHPNRDDLQLIVDQTLRCKEIVQNLLDFSRRSGGEWVRFNLNENLVKVIALFKNQSLFHNIKIEKQLADDLPLVEGDPAQINQVLTNLIMNAAQAMEGKGALTLITRATFDEAGVEVEVVDTGVGIAKENIRKIFDPFYTTKVVGKGTGLGLSTAYGIVERHGGTINVSSEVGKGTSFVVRLPAPSESGTAGEPRPMETAT